MIIFLLDLTDGLTGNNIFTLNVTDPVKYHSDSTVLVYPRGNIYRTGKFKNLWPGNNYREGCVTPIEIQYLIS